MINANNIKNNPQFNSINPSKFQIVQGRTNIHDKAPETKPVSYFKDAWNRFKKNKGSVVAAVIIAILVLFAIFGPIFSSYTVAYSDSYFSYCLPKSNMSEVFDWDFWDGCKEDVMNKAKFNYFYAIGAESVRIVGEENAHTAIKRQEYEVLETDDNGNPTSYAVRFDTYNKKGCIFIDLNIDEYKALQEYQDRTGIQVIYPITKYDSRPTTADGAGKDANYWMKTKVEMGKAVIELDENGNYIPIYEMYVRNETPNKDGYVYDYDRYTSKLYEYQYTTDGKLKYVPLRDDKGNEILVSNLSAEERAKYEGDSFYYVNSSGRVMVPARKYQYARKNQTGYEVRVNYYEYYVYKHTELLKDGIEKPVFLFGSSDYGHDIFTQLAGGARFSFLFAIAVSVVNMLVGTIYGAIEGYYGGAADIIMERICDILGSVPTMIVITLLKMHMRGTAMQKNGHLIILFITYFATGWMGMAGRVRMQFYRFKNQEYVLAARTLGARDRRIMFKHIFPNSLGTIVTGSVLVIPGMIFSESSLSYLGIINLSTGNLTSVGTLLAKADPYLADYPYMMVFPAVFISLLMLSFNLFGNGLRDAFNPSLRGAEE